MNYIAGIKIKIFFIALLLTVSGLREKETS